MTLKCCQASADVRALGRYTATMHARPGTPLFLSPAAAARRLNISVKTLAAWRQQGTGPAATRLGGRVAYRIDDVAAFEQRRRSRSGRQQGAVRDEVEALTGR